MRYTWLPFFAVSLPQAWVSFKMTFPLFMFIKNSLLTCDPFVGTAFPRNRQRLLKGGEMSLKSGVNVCRYRYAPEIGIPSYISHCYIIIMVKYTAASTNRQLTTSRRNTSIYILVPRLINLLS